ncbi:hypothetical protein BDR06DRAFT_98162 [Suillus hirtellus]|nr:hypothetical protein BDR06DRAFT_98162 [Suillus hirtellus]
MHGKMNRYTPISSDQNMLGQSIKRTHLLIALMISICVCMFRLYTVLPAQRSSNVQLRRWVYCLVSHNGEPLVDE